MSGSIRAKMGNDNDALNRERKSGWLKAASHQKAKTKRLDVVGGGDAIWEQDKTQRLA
jgi:hypothetical protein